MIKQGLEEDYMEFMTVNSHDPLGQAGVNMVNIWGDMMEKAMQDGSTVAEAAEATMLSAENAVGGSGTLTEMVRCDLQKYWAHGDELREWHDQQMAQLDADFDAWYEETGAREMAELKAEDVGQGFGMQFGM